MLSREVKLLIENNFTEAFYLQMEAAWPDHDIVPAVEHYLNTLADFHRTYPSLTPIPPPQIGHSLAARDTWIHARAALDEDWFANDAQDDNYLRAYLEDMNAEIWRQLMVREICVRGEGWRHVPWEEVQAWEWSDDERSFHYGQWESKGIKLADWLKIHLEGGGGGGREERGGTFTGDGGGEKGGMER
ncbi:unnamed protein product [Zymoseptoria tritici ST99CH_1A5]|uniref:Uncharacterized protein n=2 Tax=Zymoseptoria tritici TaxID=1047171 RepID=F9XP82_ZYMTI|nr:uncharacterized protein MYCGRDRAFT_97209 [Zymoseptoria tritici IPO323]EGP83003.1 hypothetical protein MYCGRDRAFT_97209 [Zymoseptoria tritici IPO323]SMR64275.1 unnamed protein product [Zymoseptoria tritici ST99CH_3D1]SMY29621.1 unnamed protein product [Zymoseptoria tritici ST99CH_1A5]